MKKIGLVGIAAGALSAAVIGFAGPAQADGTGFGFNGHDSGSNYDYGFAMITAIILGWASFSRQ